MERQALGADVASSRHSPRRTGKLQQTIPGPFGSGRGEHRQHQRAAEGGLTVGEAYTIAEVAERTGLSVHTLRYYEQAGLIESVARSRSGQRRYSTSDITHVRLLTTLRNSGMTVADVRHYVQLSRSRPNTPELRQLLLKHRRAICSQLDHLRQALKEIDARLRATQPEETPP